MFSVEAVLIFKDSCLYIQNDTEESNERSLGRSRSPRSEDRFKWHHQKRSSIDGRSEDGGFKYYYDERRSPRFARENSKQGGLTRTPARFEVVDDRFREDERGSRRFSSAESKLTITLPGFKKNVDGSRSPVVRPVGDILGDKVPPLKVGVISKQIDGKDAKGSANNQVHELPCHARCWLV